MAKQNRMLVFVVIGIALIAFFYLYPGMAQPKTLKEIGEPADLASEEEGKGMEITFYKKVDGEWVPVSTPDWFTAGAQIEPYAIVEHPPAPTCVVRTECAGYATNPDIACWLGRCVLANVDGMSVTVKTQNSELYDINNVYISDVVTEVTPTGLMTALPVGLINQKTLPGLGLVFWTSEIMDFELEGWLDTEQTFSVRVYGTHPLTGATISSSADAILQFTSDPTGTFSVIIETGIPA